MSRVPYRMMTALATSALATGALLLSVATASGSATDTLVSGDARATVHDDNLTANGDKASGKDGCALAGLAGSPIEIDPANFKVNGTKLTITSVPDGSTLTGVVVKGSSAYNVYAGDVRDGLHAPINASGGPAGISHWFACATKAGETLNATTSGGNTTAGTTGGPEDATAAGEAGASGSGVVDAAATGSDTAVSAAELADTGFSARVPMLVAGILLLLGAGLVTATRRRLFRRT